MQTKNLPGVSTSRRLVAAWGPCSRKPPRHRKVSLPAGTFPGPKDPSSQAWVASVVPIPSYLLFPAELAQLSKKRLNPQSF